MVVVVRDKILVVHNRSIYSDYTGSTKKKQIYMDSSKKSTKQIQRKVPKTQIKGGEKLRKGYMEVNYMGRRK